MKPQRTMGRKGAFRVQLTGREDLRVVKTIKGAIEVPGENASTEWCEKVDDDAYGRLEGKER